MPKEYLEENVYNLSLKRIEQALLTHEDYYVSFSGGKDSSTLLFLVIEVAKKLDKLPVKVVFHDLELVYENTINYAKYIASLEEVEMHWLCVEELEDNASSIYERYFKQWDINKKDKWMHDIPSYAITNRNMPDNLKKYYHPNNLEKWTIELYGEFLCDELGRNNICNFIGLRTEESYGRYMNIQAQKNRNKKNKWTYTSKASGERTWICLPIYDWEFSDVWKYLSDKRYNPIYDMMFLKGMPFSEMRTCHFVGEEQKKSLYLIREFEPDTFNKLLDRVEGITFGSIYNHTNLNRGKVIKPEEITWKQYLTLLMNELPEEIKEIYEEKFELVFAYHKREYEVKENISPDIYVQDSRKDVVNAMKEHDLTRKYFIAYETLCGAIIKRDLVFKKYGFGYSKKMSKRIEEVQKKWQEKL